MLKMTRFQTNLCIDCVVLVQGPEQSCLFLRTMADWPAMKIDRPTSHHCLTQLPTVQVLVKMVLNPAGSHIQIVLPY